MTRLAVASVCLGISLVTFFRYPGHTWLQQDTQIYVPALEHQRDPAVLRNDLLVEHPHVAFTLYDEAARALRAVTGQGFREVLAAQQIATRALGIWGLFLLATALGLGAGPAFLVAAICALGATITGPQVLSFEFEPTPRAFAVPLILCGAGLAAQHRYLAAGIAGAAAFLYHPPTSLPFWGLYLVLAMWPAKAAVMRRRFRGALPLAAAVLVLAAAAHGADTQPLFGKIPPLQEQLERMRTAYAWISTWHTAWIVNYCLLWLIGIAAFARLRRRVSLEFEIFLVGLPLLGMVSMPLSWLLLDHWKWALIPEFQPMRGLLFVSVAMQFLCAAAGAQAVLSRRWAEGLGWFALAYLLPAQPVLTESLAWRPLLIALLLGGVALIAVRLPVLGLAAFFAFPVAYPALHTPDLRALSGWARGATAQDSVFLFPDAGHGLWPGIFRAEALRAVFIDWKSGGEVNYRADFAAQWWARWQFAMSGTVNLPAYEAAGISYVVLKAEHRLAQAPVFENRGYVVYALKP